MGETASIIHAIGNALSAILPGQFDDLLHLRLMLLVTAQTVNEGAVNFQDVCR